jgi:hypothetical protein
MMVIIVQRKRRVKTRECGDRYGGTAGTGVDLCQWRAFSFDSDDDVDVDVDVDDN